MLIFLVGDDMKVMENDTEWQFVTLGDQVLMNDCVVGNLTQFMSSVDVPYRCPEKLSNDFFSFFLFAIGGAKGYLLVQCWINMNKKFILLC